MSFATKHRPRDFKQVVGNESVVASLRTVVRKKEPPHTYLLSGPYGCGKTTLARIIAKEVGCVENGIIEINTANNRGIDTAREIISTLSMPYLDGSARIYILDEVHRTNVAFQSALLKATEDTPKHAFFVLCTNYPEKLLPELRNRCSEYSVDLLTDYEIAELVKIIYGKERKGTTIEGASWIIDLVVQAADGCARTALNKLEQIIYLDPKTQRAKIEKLMLSVNEKSEEIINLCRGLSTRTNWAKIIKIYKGLDQNDPESIRLAIRGYCSSIMLSGPHDSPGSIRAAYVSGCFSSTMYNTDRNEFILALWEAFDAG